MRETSIIGVLLVLPMATMTETEIEGGVDLVLQGIEGLLFDILCSCLC